MLRAREAALNAMGIHEPQSLEISGRLTGLGLSGFFHSWHEGENDRFDQLLGSRSESTVRVGDREYVRNSSGNVREISGTLAQRQRTQDFIFSDDLTKKPQYSTAIRRTTLPDGRAVVQLRVAPPGGDVETVSLDESSYLIDQVAYVEGDGIQTATYSDYRPVRGALVAYREVDSNGDTAYDEVQDVTDVQVDRKLDPQTFSVPQSAVVNMDAPITVGLIEESGHFFVPVAIHGHTYRFLLDTGAQGVVVDSKVAKALGLVPQGTLELRGAKRVGGEGTAALDSVQVAGVDIPVKDVSLVDLSGATGGALMSDGVLGYPFFAAAEVRLDGTHRTMTFGKPGSLPPLGERVPLDTDRELPEMSIAIDGAKTQALIDIGSGSEILIFTSFVDKHAGLLSSMGEPLRNFGIGGAMNAVGAKVDELDLGQYRMFHCNASVIMATSGAFADKIDGADVGLPVLRNFVVTFDLANRAMYLKPGDAFDDGRSRE